MGIFFEALDALSGRWKAIILACVLPLTISVLLEFVPIAENTFASILVDFVDLGLYTCIAVAVHRIILVGPSSVPMLGVMLYFSRRELRFVGMLLMFGAVFFGLMLLTKWVFVFSLIAFAAALYGIPVFSIVFPAVAVDSDLTLRELLAIGRCHYWLLAKAALILPIIFGLLSNVAAKQVAGMSGMVPETFLNLFGQIGTALILIIEIAMLSVAYAEIEERESPAGVYGS